MNEQATVTHVWPYNRLINPHAQPLSNERESDVWGELRDLTFDDEVRGDILFLTHEEDIICSNGEWGNNHAVTCTSLIKQLQEDSVVNNRVSFFEQREIEQKIHHPATEGFSFVSQTLAQLGTSEPGTRITVPAESAGVETRKKRVPVHLGSKQDATEIIEQYRIHQICALVLWRPEFNPYGSGHYLKHLSLVRSRCPDLPIYIFHEEYLDRQWGVEREGRAASWQSSFHTRTEALTIPENVDVVVRGLCNVGSVSMWGALPKHGKSYLFLSLMKSLLSGKPWLDYFEVSQAKRVVYLVPEVGLRGVMKRLRKLNMVDYLYDPSTAPDGVLFLQTLSSRDKLKLDDSALLQAVEGSDVFVDPLIRYIEGEENNASDQRMLSNKLLALISAEARSVWCAHHSPKAFKDVTDITTQNVLRGTGEFAAFPDIIFGVLKTNEETSRLYIKCTDARDDDEYLGDFEVEMRPWIDETGDLKLVVEPGTGTPLREQRQSKSGPKNNPDRQVKIDFARSVDGSLQEKANAVNEKFGSKHSRSTICEWLKEFDGEVA